jgi:hypothetical protein
MMCDGRARSDRPKAAHEDTDCPGAARAAGVITRIGALVDRISNSGAELAAIVATTRTRVTEFDEVISRLTARGRAQPFTSIALPHRA